MISWNALPSLKPILVLSKVTAIGFIENMLRLSLQLAYIRHTLKSEFTNLNSKLPMMDILIKLKNDIFNDYCTNIP